MIGIFDSGLGGISVLAAIVMPSNMCVWAFSVR